MSPVALMLPTFGASVRMSGLLTNIIQGTDVCRSLVFGYSS